MPFKSLITFLVKPTLQVQLVFRPFGRQYVVGTRSPFSFNGCQWCCTRLKIRAPSRKATLARENIPDLFNATSRNSLRIQNGTGTASRSHNYIGRRFVPLEAYRRNASSSTCSVPHEAFRRHASSGTCSVPLEAHRRHASNGTSWVPLKTHERHATS